MSLFENIRIKLMALAMGLLLWIHVATEKVYNHEVTLPVRDVLLKDHLALAESPPESLTVVVAAKGKQLLRHKWRERGVRINASLMSVGRDELTLTSSNTTLIKAEEVTLEEVVIPRSVTLQVDNLTHKSVQVVPDIVPVPDEGYTVRRISEPSPAEVLLSGPRTLIKDVTTIATIRKEVKPLRTDLTLTVPLVTPAGYGIKVKPESVTLTLEVVPIKTKSFPAVPIVVVNAPAGKSARTSPASVQLELTGSPDEIDRLDPGTVLASVNYDEADALGLAQVRLSFPAGFKLKRTSIRQTRIIID
jgi:YbbR domain-containing protein